MRNVSKYDIAGAVSKKTGIKPKLAIQCVDAFFQEISDALAVGEPVKIAKLGSMSVNQKRERVGRNIATKAPVLITARKVVSFKCSNLLKEELNGEKR